MTWQVKTTPSFWRTVKELKPDYSREEHADILRSIDDCIRELEEKGSVEETGWSEHELRRYPFDDGGHFEFCIYNDDILVVYFRVLRKRTIRMVGVYSHRSIPGSKRG